MAVQKLVTKVMLSKLAKVNKSTITKAAEASLKNAMVGTKVNINHPDAIKFIAHHTSSEVIAKKATKAEKTVKNTKISKTEKKPTKKTKKDIDITEYLDLSLRDIIEKFGTDYLFVEWLKAVKNIEEIKEKRIKNEVSLGNLIPRDYVKKHILALIETANNRLLNDSPRTIAARVLEEKESGSSKEDIEKLVSELIGVQIKGIKLRARRALRE